MKRILILVVALGLFLCSTASAGQGGGGESTKPKPSPKKTSGIKSTTTSSRPPAPPARPRSPTVASLMVNSNLPNVTVTINGRTAGTTDSNGYLLLGSLKPGVYNVTITRPGYQPDKKVVSLSAGQSETLNFELRPITQALTVSSTPPDCEVLVDDVPIGSTGASGNARFTHVPIGEHKITVRKARYRRADFAISLSQDKEGQVNANLEMAIGFLAISANVPAATIEVGCKRIEESLPKFECDPGTYAVTVSSPLYVTSRKEVSVSAGQEAQLSLDLEADTEARYRLITEAQEAFFAKQYDRAVTLAKTLLSADSKHSKALAVLAQSYFMKDDFSSFLRFGSQALEAGGSLEFRLKHQHGAGASIMHPVRVVLTAQTLSFDPQLGQDIWCANPAFKVSLAVLGTAEVGGNRDNEIYLRLVFVDPNKPKKTTTLNLADRESHLVEKQKSTAGGFVLYRGHTMVSRRQAYGAMTAIAALLNRAKASMGRK
ncbi:MAG TPA: carboxypeptidase regulatory-like domain-containing protein [Pyrinomonadaceae bacterium]